jgi:hypothetical protein
MYVFLVGWLIVDSELRYMMTVDALDMNKDDADCGPLIEHTAGTLDDEVVEQLFVSTQKTNLELCMKYAAER